jgi:Ser/Thr protein kinase RdoA (MazF antagonist)
MTDFGDIDARAILQDVYGLDAATAPLPSEYDRNFLVETAGGERFVLKVMRGNIEPGLVSLQCDALDQLARRDPSLTLPRVRKTRDGGPTGTILDRDGVEHVVWMLSHVPGRTMASARPHTPELLYGLGRILGRFDAALDGWSHPGAQRDLKWDLAKAGWIGSHLDHIDDRKRRLLVEHILSLYQQEVVPVPQAANGHHTQRCKRLQRPRGQRRPGRCPRGGQRDRLRRLAAHGHRFRTGDRRRLRPPGMA